MDQRIAQGDRDAGGSPAAARYRALSPREQRHTPRSLNSADRDVALVATSGDFTGFSGTFGDAGGVRRDDTY